MKFRDQPIARKALTLGLLPALCALVIVVVAFALAFFLSARSTLARDNEALVALVADNINAAVSFNNPDEARQLLRGLRAKPDVDKVCVYDAAGQLFADYGSAGYTCARTEMADPPATQQPHFYTRPVVVGDRRIGSVALFTNERSLYEQMTALAMTAAAALFVSAVIAALLAVRMQRSISGPITALAVTANRVAETREFSIRATKTTQDEVGQLVRAFNDMLGEIERQNRIKDEFLATLSHELRTPLNATLGWLQILQKTNPSPDKVERGLASMERNARAQQRVVEDLLDVSRIVTGRLQMKSEVLDLRSVVTAAVEVVAEAAQNKGLTLQSIVPTEPCLVTGDAARLQQAMWNLLSNSVKFTPPGGSIDVRLTTSGTSYVFTVRDTGIGMSREFLPRAFDRFQQADGSSTREHGGLGLGLAIVKEISELHGATVTAQSDGLGTGSTFTIRIPQLVGAADVGTD
jgi:signal transduction histidine kinase